jgi:anti-sigma factor RsiW
MKKNCIPEEDLSAYADHELSDRKSRVLEDHLDLCPACREKLAEFKQTDLLLKSFSDMEPSADFDREFWKKVHALEDPREKAGWFRLPWRLMPRPMLTAGLAAGCAALLAFSLVFYRQAARPGEKEEIFMAEHLELLDEFELIRHLDLMEDWEAINEMKDHT